jgi:hypothetical protein
MAESSLTLFEVIHVRQDERQRGFEADRPRKLEMQHLVAAATVGEPRERVTSACARRWHAGAALCPGPITA